MEIGRWFRKDTIEEKLADLRAGQERVRVVDIAVLRSTVLGFQGNSKEEVFELLKNYTLAKISRPFYTIPWYDQPTHEEAVKDLLDTLINFNEPLIRSRIFDWVAAIMGSVLDPSYAIPEEREMRMQLIRSSIRGLTMFAPYETTVTFDGKHFIAEKPKPLNLSLPQFNNPKLMGKEFIDYHEKRIKKYF
jgi:hypothetical protein